MMRDDRRDSFYDTHFETCRELFPSFDELSSRVLLDLVLTCDVVSQIVARYLAEFGLSKSTYNVLMMLRSGPPEGIELHDLGELLLVSRANITGLIDHLENKGYVTRQVSETDRRVRQARLTAKAVALLDRVTPIHHINLSRLLDGLTGDDKLAVRELLKKMRRSFRANAAQCALELATVPNPL